MGFFLILIEKSRRTFACFYGLRLALGCRRIAGTVFIIQMQLVSVKTDIAQIIRARFHQEIGIIPIAMFVVIFAVRIICDLRNYIFLGIAKGKITVHCIFPVRA